MKLDAIASSSTAELLAFYNEHATTPIKKFADRATAEARVRKIIEELPSTKIAASWNDSTVRAARSTRTSVSVGGNTYRSVADAFRKLGLPMGKHVAFRVALKATGAKGIQGHTFKTL